ncbi:MAG: hypothetical protein GJT30_05255 [Geobacter sp.]|nr:hypothetical protein [Geobacter sp.]
MVLQYIFLFVGAVILMVVCPALMLCLTIALDSIKPRLGFDLSGITSPILDVCFIPFLFASNIYDGIVGGFSNSELKAQEAYWKDVYAKNNY